MKNTRYPEKLKKMSEQQAESPINRRVRETLSVQEVEPAELEQILKSKEYRSFRESEPGKTADDFLDLAGLEGDPRLFDAEYYSSNGRASKHSENDVRDFADRMVACYDLVKQMGPDAVVYPLRGAEVFKLSFEKISEVRGEQESLPFPIFLPTGTHGSSYMIDEIKRGRFREKNKESLDRCLTSFKKYENRAIVQVTLEQASQKTSLDRILLMDEVNTGGSILNHLKYISRCLSSAGEIDVLAVEYARSFKGEIMRDDSNRLVPSRKIGSYLNRRDGRSSRALKPFSLARLTPPLVMDRQRILPLVIRESGSEYEIKVYSSERRIPDILSAVSERAGEDRMLPLERKMPAPGPYIRPSPDAYLK